MTPEQVEKAADAFCATVATSHRVHADIHVNGKVFDSGAVVTSAIREAFLAGAALVSPSPSVDLRKWAKHEPTCEKAPNHLEPHPILRCTCGLEAALVSPGAAHQTIAEIQRIIDTPQRLLGPDAHEDALCSGLHDHGPDKVRLIRSLLAKEPSPALSPGAANK